MIIADEQSTSQIFGLRLRSCNAAESLDCGHGASLSTQELEFQKAFLPGRESTNEPVVGALPLVPV